MWKAPAPFRRYKVTLLAALLGLTGIIGVTSSIAAFSADAPGRGRWTWQNPLPNGNDLGAACASQLVCYVTGIPGGMLVTTDGGSTWFPKSLNVSGVTGSMSCPTALDCYLGVGNQILHTTNGWASWDRQASPITVSPPVIAFVGSLSCPTATTCFGLVPTGSQHPGPTYVVTTTDSGAAWKTLPGYLGMVASIACPGTTTCYVAGAFGNVLASKDGGNSWSASQPVQYDLNQLSCPALNVCATAGWNQAITTVDGGLHWTVHTTAASINASLTGMSCPTVARCLATGRDGDTMIALASNNGGSTWQTIYRPASRGWLGNVACPTVATCVAAGDHGWIAVTHDGGATWSSPSSGITTPLNAVSCPDEQTCFGAGDSGTLLTTANAGRTWSGQASGTTARLLAISCPDAAHCTAVGAGGTIIETSDAGLHWTSVASKSTQDLFSISCPDTTRCVVVGQTRTTLVITTGVVPALGPFTSDLKGVSCPSATTCYVVGSANDYPKRNGSIDVSTDGGMNWSPQDSTDVNGLVAISCTVGTTACTAIDSANMVSTTNGATWSVRGPVGNGMTAVSCPAQGACVALSPWDGIISTNDSGATSQVQPPVAPRQLFGVSCPSVTVCTVVGDNGAILSNRHRVVPSSVPPPAQSLPARTGPPPAPPQLPPPPPASPAHAAARSVIKPAAINEQVGRLHPAAGVLQHRVS